MALDFSVLQGMDPAGAFFRGQEAVRAERDRNMLRQMQAEQMAAQRENMLAQREDRRLVAAERQAKMDRAAQRQTFLGGLSAEMAKGGYKLDRPTLGKMLDFGMSSGEDSLIKLATEGLRALDEDEREQSELARLGMGGTPAAAAPATLPAAAPAAPPNLLAGTPYDIGPVNALAAPAPAAAPAGVTREQVQNMLTSPSARVREQGKALVGTLPKEAEPTAGMREYQEAVRQGFKGTFMEYKQALQPKPAQVNVKLPEQERAFEAKLGAEQAEKLVKDKAVADDARSIISTIEEGRRLLKSGIITGFGADFLTGLGSALNQAGISFAEDSVANTEAFTANMAANVGRIIKQFGAGTGLSNADREYAEKMAGGKVTLNQKSIERILDINERMARNVIALHNRNAAKVKTNIPLTVEEPPRAGAQAGGASVTLPDGRVMNFPNAEAAAAFKKAAGL